jgi:hypothetical protein
LKDEASASVVNNWEKEMQSLLQEDTHSSSLLESMLSATLPVLKFDAGNGYVERQGRWAEALSRLAADHPLAHSGSGRITLDAVREMLDFRVAASIPSIQAPIAVATSVSKQASSQSSAVSVPSMTPEETRSGALAALSDVGVLLTIETTVTAQGPGMARVERVVFPGKDINSLFSFTLNVETKLVSSIRKGDQSLPFSLPLDQFAAWAKGK